MKKFFSFFGIALMMLAMASCEKKDVDQVSNKTVVDIQIDQSEWSYSDLKNNNYFYGVISVPELTWDIYNYGVIKMYREYSNGTDNASQVELPYVRLNEYSYTIEGDTTGTTYWGQYTETVDYELTAGQVTIYYTASDFDYELNTSYVPDAMHFRLIMMW